MDSQVSVNDIEHCLNHWAPECIDCEPVHFITFGVVPSPHIRIFTYSNSPLEDFILLRRGKRITVKIIKQ
jgi:hypothetical protein